MELDHHNENYQEGYDDSNEIIDEEDQEIVNGNHKDEETKLGLKVEGSEKLPPNIQIKPPGTKQKRRSKNDCNGRDYVCGCGKTYLSYPALYTHIKTKHNGKTPDGTNANHFDNGKGRGRPRKNFLVNEESTRRPVEYKDEDFDEKNPEMKELYKNLNNNNINNIQQDAKESTEEMYDTIFKNLGLFGGPSDPLEGFPDMKKVNDASRSNYQPLYKKVKFYLSQNIGTGLESKIDIDDDEKESKLVCDDIFALYLIDVSKKVIPRFYKIIVIFIRFYRECMNKLGWEILYNFKELEDEPTYLDYCSVKNAEFIPQISNDFNTQFFNKKFPDFDKNIAIVLTSHFCDWLFKKNYTHLKLNLNKSGGDGTTLFN